ncbi:MAG: EscU/YscU/HrcU family type III secretion system export apparatus switch protein [Chlamydiae bacterium RIFCSPHIGHO2_12_FULL_44_59]|nr:MAG: EscU/YscU/HrcU family type III secretion system export apparatus switch protein [Chlamydiae bacterium RIFCSPHIGHO2_01_FULL_44_39]OGN59387.1 MAG: EscU/YscU/HrcU family type III secretion system export apparatus switch protein [Chlamydiae bacterium RIFCSPHIGHO2_02_FULL_45_9]OGN59641.1 MAG: EscU/YscU/HrcU family type III secretion system export apparatus switch protein [Chlamydiae bacterium RIFCSPHIGHO2_12_FULL_44_59]OGN65731.1 MAG: EscU/YscU/HrcU family type III secretion system export app
MAEKTEKATPKKIKDARKKGQIAKAQDMPASLTFITSIMGTLAAAGYIYNNLTSFLLLMFREAAETGPDTQEKTAAFFLIAAQLILRTSLPIMAIVCFVGVLVSFLVQGPVFSMEAMKFDLKKLNPIQGIKNKFKLKVLVELLKSIAKIAGAAIIIYIVILSSLPQIIATVMMPIVGAATVVHDFLFTAVLRVGIFFLLVGLFDLAFQRKNFAKEMKMEKFEIKQEYKDTEGDPMIKGKRRELFREIAYQEGPRAARRARAIITNPTHIAVALKYNPPEEVAPIILTMGTGYVADAIIKIGLENNIPIMRNVDLARELYSKGKISDYVPEETYEAVAEILKWIDSLEENPDVNLELFR